MRDFDGSAATRTP